MTAICKHCNTSFKVSNEDKEMIDNGYCEAPEVCGDCLYNIENPDYSYMEYSDADNGL